MLHLGNSKIKDRLSELGWGDIDDRSSEMYARLRCHCRCIMADSVNVRVWLV